MAKIGTHNKRLRGDFGPEHTAVLGEDMADPVLDEEDNLDMTHHAEYVEPYPLNLSV